MSSRGAPLPGDFSGTGPGTLVAAETLPNLIPQLRSDTTISARITYVSTSGINDSHTLVTGTVFTPKGPAPADGWKVVAFAHQATGIQPPCAPSASPTLLGAAPAVGALVDAGYLVVVTDYQGLGLRDSDHANPGTTVGSYNDYHPFLDSTTEGYNVIDSVRAARKLVPAASKTFAVWGTGQGGQAAWAANELAPDYRGDLNLTGVVADASTAALEWMAEAAAGGTLSLDQQLMLQQFLAALKNEYEDFDLDAYRHGVVKDQWEALTACWGPAMQNRDRLTSQIRADDLRPDSVDATVALRAYLQKTSLPQAPASSPMLVVPEATEGLVPKVYTDAAVAKACALGDHIVFGVPHDSNDFSEALGWLADRFNGIAIGNDCPAPVASTPGE